jgi:predicted nucleic acid-binding protein
MLRVVSVAALRCLIDTNIFDAIAAEPEMVALVDRLTNARRLELLAETTSVEQIAAVADDVHRKQLRRVRVLVVPPAGEAADTVLVAALGARRGVGHEDAVIAAAAVAHRVPLVTEDRSLREAVAELVPRLELWRWRADLRPRLRALA